MLGSNLQSAHQPVHRRFLRIAATGSYGLRPVTPAMSVPRRARPTMKYLLLWNQLDTWLVPEQVPSSDREAAVSRLSGLDHYRQRRCGAHLAQRKRTVTYFGVVAPDSASEHLATSRRRSRRRGACWEWSSLSSSSRGQSLPCPRRRAGGGLGNPGTADPFRAIGRRPSTSAGRRTLRRTRRARGDKLGGMVGGMARGSEGPNWPVFDPPRHHPAAQPERP